MYRPSSAGGKRMVEDVYKRSEYRRLIAWESRIAREGPFLDRLVKSVPDRSVLDLGCGTGEHVAWYARQGARAVGIDRSESMIEHARDHEARGEGRFVLGDASKAREALRTGLGETPAPFGLLLCLGNMIPHLRDAESLGGILREARELLVPRGKLLIQILNYRRILDRGVRHLALNFREGDREGEEIVFLRLLKPAPDGGMIFCPTTLTFDPEREEPVAVKQSKRVDLRAWLPEDLDAALELQGFSAERFGNMEGDPFAPRESGDLVVVAKKEA
jgi:SAM-dependent methyltransferase